MGHLVFSSELNSEIKLELKNVQFGAHVEINFNFYELQILKLVKVQFGAQVKVDSKLKLANTSTTSQMLWKYKI